MEPDNVLNTLEPLFDEIKPYMVTLAVAVARPLGLIAVYPVFTRAQIGRIVRTGFAIALLLPVFAALHAERLSLITPGVADPVLSNSLRLTLLGLKEFAVGFLLGIILAIPFWAILLVGEIVDMQRGVTISEMEDPGTQGQASVTNTLLTISAITIFVSAGGLLIVVSLLYQSYLVWPLTTFLPELSFEGFLNLGASLDHLFLYALLVGGPFLVLFFLSDISVALMERFTPRLSSFALSPIVKNLLFVGLLAVYGAFIVTYLRDELSRSNAGADFLRSLLTGP